jgi:ribosomal protein S18 acetylase RimI-like enzyme
MFRLRELQWPDDRDALCALDISFTTDRMYRVTANGLSFILEAAPLVPPLYKDYDIAKHVDHLSAFDYIVVAEEGTTLVGVAALEIEGWNRRSEMWHLYVDAAHRGRGIGRALVENIVQAAKDRQARCLWLETQNVNYGAIQFYQRMGFQCCGLDMTLYDPKSLETNETAVFFVRSV